MAIGIIGVILAQMMFVEQQTLEFAYAALAFIVLIAFAIMSELRARASATAPPLPIRIYCILLAVLGVIVLVTGLGFSAPLMRTHPVDAAIGFAPICVLLVSVWAFWRMRWWGPASMILTSGLILAWQVKASLLEPLAQTLGLHALLALPPLVLGIVYRRQMS